MTSIRVSSDGWVTRPGPENTRVHMRIGRNESGQFVVTDVFVHGEHVTAAVLRGIQPSRVESIARLGDDEREQANAHGKPVTLTVPLLLADAAYRGPDDSITLAELRRRSVGLETEEENDRPRLGRPDGSEPNVFYASVAAAYRDYAKTTKAAAARIAEEADVPVSTAHRWVREARRRGFLPAGQRGKTG